MPERPDNDERFTFGLTYDVAKVLSDHGYPTTTGAEFVTLQQALFQVLYNDTELGTRALQTVDAESSAPAHNPQPPPATDGDSGHGDSA